MTAALNEVGFTVRAETYEYSPTDEQHRAGVSAYTSSFDLADTYVFGKQSLGPFHCDLVIFLRLYIFHAVPLLPKLRGYFAEFLNNSSSARLRILSSPTCVGLRYGRLFAR